MRPAAGAFGASPGQALGRGGVDGTEALDFEQAITIRDTIRSLERRVGTLGG